jgi:ADP-ribosylation factor GTPase-activating protein 2/3
VCRWGADRCREGRSEWATVYVRIYVCTKTRVSTSRSILLDSWTWEQLRTMKVGGNANARKFFESHGDSRGKDAKTKYSSRVAMMYREHLERLAEQDRQKYGETVKLEDYSEVETHEKKNDDFFHESNYVSSSPSPTDDTPLPKTQLDMHKNIIGKKAASSSKTGKLGGKMTLGARRVTTDLDELERRAKEEAEKQKEENLSRVHVE